MFKRRLMGLQNFNKFNEEILPGISEILKYEWHQDHVRRIFKILEQWFAYLLNLWWIAGIKKYLTIHCSNQYKLTSNHTNHYFTIYSYSIHQFYSHMTMISQFVYFPHIKICISWLQLTESSPLQLLVKVQYLS